MGGWVAICGGVEIFSSDGQGRRVELVAQGTLMMALAVVLSYALSSLLIRYAEFRGGFFTMDDFVWLARC